MKKTLKQELQVKETSGKRDQGEFDQHDLLCHLSVLHYTLPPLPPHLLLIIIIILLLLLNLLLLLLFKSNSEYLVRNPVQAVLQTNKRLMAKHFILHIFGLA